MVCIVLSVLSLVIILLAKNGVATLLIRFRVDLLSFAVFECTDDFAHVGSLETRTKVQPSPCYRHRLPRVHLHHYSPEAVASVHYFHRIV